MPGSILGSAVLRSEDPRFLTGAGRYVENLRREGALHAVFVRSPLAHARVRAVEAEAARGLPGVVGVFTAADLDLPPMPKPRRVPDPCARPVLARDVVRFAGEAVAVVVARTREQAVDAAEAVVLDLDPLPAVVDPLRALEPDAPLLFPEAGSNVVREKRWASEGDPLEGAEVVIRARFVNQRLAPVPMEPLAALAEPDPDTGGVVLWTTCQAPFLLRDDLARGLGLPAEKVRVVAPDVGGGFGAKIATYPEQVAVAALALRLGAPVRYVETRSENLQAMTHGRAQVQEVELGATRDGRVVGLEARLVADMGAYPTGTYLPELTRDMASGVYRIPRADVRVQCVVTNTTPIESYRGAGRPEATAMLERAVDLLARELGLDPVEVRRRNFIPPEAFPYRTATGLSYDSGDYGRALDLALELAGYEELRREQANRRARGDPRQLGVGVSCYVEVTGWNPELGRVEVNEEGRVTVVTGVSPHGQGHETSLAQVVASTLSVPFDAVTVRHSDTSLLPYGHGTMGSRSLQVGGSAALRAAEAVVEKARRMAAQLLEASVEDVVVQDGRVGVVGAPDRTLSWAELARAAADPASLPDGEEPGLRSEVEFEMEGNTFPFGAHVAVVEVDTETGDVRLLRHVAVDDCGRIVNPVLVDGQVQGGTAQGVAQALYEEVVYDEEGNLLTGSLASYAVPSAAELVDVTIAHTETPTARNPLGAKGIGESATIGSTPAVWNAVVDALAPFGVRHVELPASPERVWRAIREARLVPGRRDGGE
ncbi:MAG TPA: xanthine dehydrogenase family protein molybdopterin-binding subunit [Actinomycetota bacterium]|nr:xanthine dehydrogenase family protein molybdopterin-binding subunit [Actinomycetota bacterium]